MATQASLPLVRCGADPEPAHERGRMSILWAPRYLHRRGHADRGGAMGVGRCVVEAVDVAHVY